MIDYNIIKPKDKARIILAGTDYRGGKFYGRFYEVEKADKSHIYFIRNIKYPSGVKREIWRKELPYVVEIEGKWKADTKDLMELEEEMLKTQVICETNYKVEKHLKSGNKVLIEREMIKKGYSSYDAKNIVNGDLGDTIDERRRNNLEDKDRY